MHPDTRLGADQGGTTAQGRNAARSGTVLIADDHEVFRYGLAQVLRRDLKASRIVEADHFEEALQLLEDASIFLALFDLRMPGLATALDLMRVRRLRPDVRLVVVSGSDAREDILAALQAGVHGYIVKNLHSESFIGRIKQVLAGEIYVPSILADLPSESVTENRTGDPAINALTERQQAVLRLLTEGLPNKKIGLELGISEGTVKMHVAAILRTMGAKNRAQAAAIGKSVFG